mmetsp:Transcript_11633/g.24557  ORF Transcript_11633/g.24557 Transcript_11633/m.24557 type:complete len:89 (+) Transcript_11633:544-810(+)
MTALTKRNDNAAAAATVVARRIKVQPKRFLEDCLPILDHDYSTISNSAPAAATNSTIVSLPNTPQLDLNSVWVEMLLHNQIALAQVKG